MRAGGNLRKHWRQFVEGGASKALAAARTSFPVHSNIHQDENEQTCYAGDVPAVDLQLCERGVEGTTHEKNDAKNDRHSSHGTGAICAVFSNGHGITRFYLQLGNDTPGGSEGTALFQA
jgi:hypothetical protein